MQLFYKIYWAIVIFLFLITPLGTKFSLIAEQFGCANAFEGPCTGLVGNLLGGIGLMMSLFGLIASQLSLLLGSIGFLVWLFRSEHKLRIFGYALLFVALWFVVQTDIVYMLLRKH